MSDVRAIFRRFWKDKSGSNALEYGLIVGLITLGIIAGVTAAGGALGGMFTRIGALIVGLAKTIAG
jgi:pilus assembly protein Flp/PilA